MWNLYSGKVAKFEKFTIHSFCAVSEKLEGGPYMAPPGAHRVKCIVYFKFIRTSRYLFLSCFYFQLAKVSLVKQERGS